MYGVPQLGRKRMKKWVQTVGRHGRSVTVYQHGNGNCYVRWWNSVAKKWHRESLKHADRELALEEAERLFSERDSAFNARRQGSITLTDLFARYENDVTAHKKAAARAEDKRRMALWQTFLGPINVDAIKKADLKRFVVERRAGRIQIPDR